MLNLLNIEAAPSYFLLYMDDDIFYQSLVNYCKSGIKKYKHFLWLLLLVVYFKISFKLLQSLASPTVVTHISPLPPVLGSVCLHTAQVRLVLLILLLLLLLLILLLLRLLLLFPREERRGKTREEWGRDYYAGLAYFLTK